jgi:BirA family biotin operon repressor/biotin-[acetyl-CoA-carboxylase] ligase
MGLVRAGMAQHGYTVFAHEQTKGKGQRNKNWFSEKGQNIAMSVVIDSQKLPSCMFLLSMAVAVSVYEFFNKYIDSEVKIKWPNDIYWRDRKAAGILIENVWQGSEWKFAIVGIGINVNQTSFAELSARAVSVKQITGKNFEPVILAQEVSRALNTKYQLLISEPSQIVPLYKTHLYKLHQTVKLKKGTRIFDAEFRDVTEDGLMVVQHSIEERFAVGEVEWLINGV